MNNFKQVIKGSVIALACAGIMGNAQAGALATSVMSMNNFTLSGISVTNVQASATGTSITAAMNGSSQTLTTTAIDTDLTPVCVGSCPAITNNAFPILSSASGAPSANFSAADMISTGNPLTTGATVTSASYVSLTSQGTGNANANNALNAIFSFNAATSGNLTFGFGAMLYQEAYLSADAKPGSSVNTNSTFNFTIRDTSVLGNPIVFNWLPGTFVSSNATSVTGTLPLNQNLTEFAGQPVQYVGSALGVAALDNFTATTGPLIAGDTYQLVANLDTSTSAIFVPEPGALALMGIGLVGLVVGSRKSFKMAS